MEIIHKVEEVIDNIKNNPEFAAAFKADPVKALEDAAHIDLPDEQVEMVIAAVKAKLSGGKEGLSGLLDGAGDLLGGLFNKK